MRNDRERRASSDEIDLVELVRVLLGQKLLIVASVMLAAAGALAYIMWVTPVYEAKVLIRPPAQSDISELNSGRGGASGLVPLGVKDVYDVYVNSLLSESLRREFFQEVYLPFLGQEGAGRFGSGLYHRFSELLTVEVESREQPLRYAIVMRFSDPQQAARWAVLYAQRAGVQAKKDVLKDIKTDANVKANNLQQQIESAQESARKQREDQIAQLQEALTIARSIGLERPSIGSGVPGAASAGMEGALTYMRGSKALEAEIDSLRKRPSDDPFIEDLRQKQSAVSAYRSLSVAPASVRVYRQDGEPVLSDQPVRPRKVLITASCILVGFLTGVLLVLGRHFWRTVGKRQVY